MIIIKPASSSLRDLEKKYERKLTEIRNYPKADFEKNKPDLTYIKNKLKKYKKYKNVILIANGGSRNSTWAFYKSLFEFRNKVNFEFLTSGEPEVIKNVKKRYSPKDTLVVAVSKSGTNINTLEPILLLLEYKILAITGEKGSKLEEIAKIKRWDIIIHPEVGGRYSGMTSCALAPAELMGLDIEEIYAGAKIGYKKYNNQNDLEKNEALKLALYFYELDQKGYTEIFSGIYSTALFGFLPLIVQLIHESEGKNGKGQTIFGDYSPESQHHTNQRFFGGKRNVVGLFMGVEKTKNDMEIKVPKEIRDIEFLGSPLSELNGNSAFKAMHYDMQGVIENAKNENIPAYELWISEISQKTIGEFMIFWQYFTMYSSIFREVNPFDQPEVEASKKIGFELRVRK